MVKVNANYSKFKYQYIFNQVDERISVFERMNPQVEIINLSMGDIVLPLPLVCIEAFHEAIDEMGGKNSFRGYGPIQGFSFLRDKVAYHDFQKRGINISADEIFVSDGSKCDIANIQELFDINSVVAIPDPTYPTYLDVNVLAGRSCSCGKPNGGCDGIVYLESNEDNNFTPRIPNRPVDLIYLCSPNNPTGTAISKKCLEDWVDYAREHKALIFYDAVYEAFIEDDSLAHSIFEIEKAREVAIEFRSFSKTSGFTGLRCAYMVIPKDCFAYTYSGEICFVHNLWSRRQSAKFNGVSYPVQRAAEAVYSDRGIKEVKDQIAYYKINSKLICRFLEDLDKLKFTGGKNSPYVWIATGGDSWSFFDLLLNKTGVACIPGIGFGKCGEGFVRVSAFSSHRNVRLAMDKIMRTIDEWWFD